MSEYKNWVGLNINKVESPNTPYNWVKNVYWCPNHTTEYDRLSGDMAVLLSQILKDNPNRGKRL